MPSKGLENIIILRTVEKAISKCLLVLEPSGSLDSPLPELISSMSYWVTSTHEAARFLSLGSSKFTGSTARFPLSCKLFLHTGSKVGFHT